MALQINLDKACIVCLQEKNEWISIFDSPNDEISIEGKILRCFPYYEEVKFEYPDKICFTCLEDLNAAYRFHNNCEQTSNLLLQCTVATQCEQIKGLANHEQNVNKDDLLNKEETNQLHYEELSSELEHIDYDYNVDNIIVEENAPNTEKLMQNVAASQIKDTALKRFKSKISKTNREDNFFVSKTAKSAQTHKNTPKICELCGNSYKYQHALLNHMRRHLNERPFKCECCEKKFVSNVELRRHMRVHTGHKPYSCSYCERCFSDFGSRIKHERTHTGERPFVCETCNKSFAYAHVLTVHLRTHTGEKKFKCNDCGRGFTKKAYLLAHTQQHGQSAEIANKDKEINDTLNPQHDILENSLEKSYVETLTCSKCGTEFSKKLHMMLHMKHCGLENTTISEIKDVDSLDESLEDCFTAYIIEEYDNNNGHLRTLENSETLEEN